MLFGSRIRRSREERRKFDSRYSLRQVAGRIGVEPAYLSKVERNEVSPPSEEKIRLLAGELGEDADDLLAMAGKVSADLLTIIRRRPRIFGPLLRRLDGASDEALSLLAGTGAARRRERGRRGGSAND